MGRKISGLSVDPATRRVIWTDPAPEEGETATPYRGKFEELRSLCMQGKMVASRLGKKGEPALLLWQFPVEMLDRFKEVYIMTHLFAGSDMGAYLRLHGVPVRMATIGRELGNLVDYDESTERERLEKVKPLIRVVTDPRLNSIGDRKGKSNPLSVSWFERDIKNGGKQVATLRRLTYNFFHNRVHSPLRSRLARRRPDAPTATCAA